NSAAFEYVVVKYDGALTYHSKESFPLTKPTVSERAIQFCVADVQATVDHSCIIVAIPPHAPFCSP
uniref:Uncharacterized protein n=1 Tax=Romanomermis culicivorax TaxID=13658 RepID=A0A915JYC1_ROMCU